MGCFTGFTVEAATVLTASLVCEFTDTCRPESSKYWHCYTPVPVSIYAQWGRNGTV